MMLEIFEFNVYACCIVYQLLIVLKTCDIESYLR